MTQVEALKLLEAAGLFFDRDEEDPPDERWMLNMNDVWSWASADGEYVQEHELVEVATYYQMYGWCGILYWVSKKNNNCRSEFYHYNRMIDFVTAEEKIREEFPNETKRAYHKTEYTIKGERE